MKEQKTLRLTLALVWGATVLSLAAILIWGGGLKPQAIVFSFMTLSLGYIGGYMAGKRIKPPLHCGVVSRLLPGKVTLGSVRRYQCPVCHRIIEL